MLHTLVKGKMASWEDHLPLVEFCYNYVIHLTLGMTPFECIYGFNPFHPLDITPLTSDIVIRLDGNKRSEPMKKMHEKVRILLEKKN